MDGNSKCIILWIIKAIVSGVIALGVLSIFALFYYNYGIRKTNTTGATDYSWENRFYSQGYEGVGYGILDENGFNNIKPYSDIDILLMGSSQMEARNVAQNKCSSYVLDSCLNDYNVYNIAVEGHNIYRNISNLDAALKEYTPSKYVILETMNIDLDNDSMIMAISGSYTKSNAYDSGIIYYMQKVPYLRIIHKQLTALKTNKDVDQFKLDDDIDDNSSDNVEIYKDNLEFFLGKYAKKCNDYGCKPIILYLPDITIDENGLLLSSYSNKEKMFLDVCTELGIELVDMSKVFESEYNSNYCIPYGFCNTSIGYGHLNEYGHKIVAEELYRKIMELEYEL